jgi:hypothetical protein
MQIFATVIVMIYAVPFLVLMLFYYNFRNREAPMWPRYWMAIGRAAAWPYHLLRWQQLRSARS